MLYVVKYQGKFGFIKPWTAGRDEYTNSLRTLYKSSLMGIEKKLFPELFNEKDLCKIKRYRIDFDTIKTVKETTRSAVPKKIKNKDKNKIKYEYQSSIVNRGVLINPTLFLVFKNKEDVDVAMKQHVCLSRNEDVMLPIELIELNNMEDFEQLEEFSGFEMEFFDNPVDNAFWCGKNKYTGKDQYGVEIMYGTPRQEQELEI